jgi:hypothetical protein
MSTNTNAPASSTNTGIGQTLYDDAASLGRIKSLIGLVVCAFIAVILIFVGFAKINTSNPHTDMVDATITQLTGCTTSDPKQTSQCTVALQYTIDGKQYTNASFPVTGKGQDMPYVNKVITVYSDHANPKSISATSASDERQMGWSLIFTAFVIVGIAYFIWWLSHRYQFFAAAEGVSAITSVFRN